MQKVAVVTGSTKGIGLAIAIDLLEEDYFVFLNYATDVMAAHKLEEELSIKYKDRFKIIQQQLDSEESVQNFYDCVTHYMPQIDVLVLNAGITDRTAWADLTWDEWEKVMNTNLNAPAALVRKFDIHFRNGGNIIFIGSVLGNHLHAVSVPYSVSKAAVHALAKTLVKEYCERGIRVNAVCPGFAETDWHKNKAREIKQRICDKVSLHRFAEPHEISCAVMDVIHSTYMNGALIDIDGGYEYK